MVILSYLVDLKGIEPPTSALQRLRSPAELQAQGPLGSSEFYLLV